MGRGVKKRDATKWILPLAANTQVKTWQCRKEREKQGDTLSNSVDSVTKNLPHRGNSQPSASLAEFSHILEEHTMAII